MTRYFCDRCGLEMNPKKYREGYRIPDPTPKYNTWDPAAELILCEDPAAELILCEVCKRAYISFIKEGEKK